MSDSTEAHETLTFVVRLWHETGAARADGHTYWRGRVEHAASQEVGYVEDVAGVVRFIERWTTRDQEEMSAHHQRTTHPCIHGSPRRALSSSLLSQGGMR
jgi:hypothetical protein